MFTVENMMRRRRGQATGPVKYKVLPLRLNIEETARWYEIFNRAMLRNQRVDQSSVIRELMELEDSGLLTEREKNFFRGRIDELTVLDTARQTKKTASSENSDLNFHRVKPEQSTIKKRASKGK